ncbi:MAG: LytTR family transcriptional regulator [Candidatus Aminicenantes bacterium]|nr:LytTR family transcriptional regulator [Candidatus Aminicenantes bacterium]
MRVFLRQPFPFYISLTQILFLSFTTGLFVSVFLLIFKPFGSGVYILEGRTWILWGYGFVTFLILLVDMLVWPAVFPGFFNETKWNVSKGIGFQFWHIVSIGTANLLYAALVGEKEIRLLAVPGYLLQALAVGFFPITLGIFYIQSILLKKYAESTRRLNENFLALENRTAVPEKNRQIVAFTSEGGKEEVEIRLHDLLFIKSADNYVEIYRTENDKIKRILLRSSLKRIEQDLKDYPFLFKCHRAFLVNIKNISRVAGNSQGYQLFFKGNEYAIPVSRYTSKNLFKLITRPQSRRNSPRLT